MGTPAEKEYAEFEDKVKRRVYFDSLPPNVKALVLKTALNQFGTVISVQFIPIYTQVSSIPQQCTLVKMESVKQAEYVIAVIANYPFIMSGMPRPVRARAARAEMFSERPIKLRRKRQCRWVDPEDPDSKVGQKLKSLSRKHAAEASVMLKEEEEKLAKQQGESLKRNTTSLK